MIPSAGRNLLGDAGTVVLGVALGHADDAFCCDDGAGMCSPVGLLARRPAPPSKRHQQRATLSTRRTKTKRGWPRVTAPLSGFLPADQLPAFADPPPCASASSRRTASAFSASDSGSRMIAATAAAKPLLWFGPFEAESVESALQTALLSAAGFSNPLSLHSLGDSVRVLAGQIATRLALTDA